MQNLGNHVFSYLKGFIGISVVIVYIQIFISEAHQLREFLSLAAILPFLTILMLIPILFMFERISKSTKIADKFSKEFPDLNDKFNEV